MESEILSFLLEALLDENIPRELANAYRKSTKHSSEKHTGEHSELNSRSRRSVLYDYGNSTYEKISSAEAIAYVKENKLNVENLRVIFDSDLVEFEVRPNGSIYAIYRNTDRSATINGVTKPNIGYFSWKAVLENAQSIYKTDEYDHPISAEQAQDRKKKSELRATGSLGDISRSHNPFNDFIGSDSFKISSVTPDTGSHSPVSPVDNSDILKRLDPDSSQGFANTGVNWNNGSISNYFKLYIENVNSKRELFIKVDQLRRALRKLDADKDEYSEADYEAKKRKWTARYTNARRSYNEQAKIVANMKSKLIVTIDELSAQSNRKLYNFAKALEALTSKGYRLQNDLIELNKADPVKAMGYSEKRDLQAAMKTLKDVLNQLEVESARIAQLQADAQQTENSTENIPDSGSIEKLQSEAAEWVTKIDNLQMDAINKHFKKIRDIESQLAQIDDSLADLRPAYMAKKRANRERNKSKEDPRLLDLLDFENPDIETV